MLAVPTGVLALFTNTAGGVFCSYGSAPFRATPRGAGIGR